MSIKTADIVPGARVITTKPARKLASGIEDELLVMEGETTDFLGGHAFLPFGVELTVVKVGRIRDVAGKIVFLETDAGQKLTAYLNFFKPRVTLVQE